MGILQNGPQHKEVYVGLKLRRPKKIRNCKLFLRASGLLVSKLVHLVAGSDNQNIRIFYIS